MHMKKAEIEERLKQYRDSLRTMETDRWIGEYAEDATVEDPVGGPVHAGHEQMRAFFNGVRKGFKLLDIQPEMTVIAPPEAAVRARVRGVTTNDRELFFDLIATYKLREDGKFVQMRAYWDAGELAKKLKS
jgi:steroid Delta-isomerase